jgi:CHAT domain-containing protein
MVVMDNGYEMEIQYCRQYRDAVFDTTKKENTFRYFWAPVEKELNGISKVYISIDGIYAKINLNSVFDHEKKSYLLERYDFQYVSTLRDLTLKKEPWSAKVSHTAALFGFPDYTSEVTAPSVSAGNNGTADYLIERKQQKDNSFHLDPLPGTKKEVEAISALMKEKGWFVSTYLGKNAQEHTLKSLSSPTILHIATHGYFEQDVDASYTPATSMLAEKMAKNPLLRSGLMMAGASNAYTINYAKTPDWAGVEDGILTAYEAMNLNLDKTELVVLSACETGLGEIRNGEGVYGLQRAFTAAGAKTLVMSLWPVSDAATQKLMTLFYSKWLETGDKHGAFRFAQLELKKTFPDPYFWSAFVMIGN